MKKCAVTSLFHLFMLLAAMLAMVISLPACKTLTGALDFDLGFGQKAETAPEPPPDLEVAVVEFLPMPESVLNKTPVNEKVLTGEFHSDAEEVDFDKGYLVPHEYLSIIHENIRTAAALRDLNLVVLSSLGGIKPGAYDVIVLGMVTQAQVDDDASVSLNVRLLDGNSFVTLETITIANDEGKMLGNPLHEPVHFIGEHEQDCQNQRTLLSYAAFLCANDLVDAVLKRGAS